jgi:hypothetical protein
MIDPDGEEWATVVEALDCAPHLTAATIRKWRSRGKVRGHVIGRLLYVNLPDVTRMEADARHADWRAGRRAPSMSH